MNKLTSKVELNDEALMKHMNENHPRWYQLVEIYGNPTESASLKKMGNNIASTSAKVKLIAKTVSSKSFEKKLLLNMTVKDLKAMCAKLFKIEVIKSKLVYNSED